MIKQHPIMVAVPTQVLAIFRDGQNIQELLCRHLLTG